MATQEAPKSRILPGQSFWPILLLALCLTMALQVVRTFVTSLVYAFGDRFGQTQASIPALIVFSLPVLAALGGRLNPRLFLAITAGGLALLRLAMQVSRNVDLNMILAGLAIPLALMALIQLLATLRTARVVGPRDILLGIFFGLSLETGLHGAFLTWDYLWQPGWLPLLAAALVSGLAFVAVRKVQACLPSRHPGELPGRDLKYLPGLGMFFMLEFLFFQNPAFVASSGLVPLEAGLAVVFIGNMLGLSSAAFLSRPSFALRLVTALALVTVTLLMLNTTGLALVLLVLVGQVAAAALLACTLGQTAAEERRPGLWRTSLAVTGGSLLFMTMSILYYISTLITLPFSYTILPVVAAVLLGLAVFHKSQPVPGVDWRLAGLPLALLVIPLILYLTRPTPAQAALPESSELRFVDYNIRQSINYHGWLDPEGVARVIEAQQPDIVVLQEVSRGWVIAGGMDDAEWLARRLNMPYIYVPGHDYQFGNLLFTRLPVSEWSYTRLPLLNVPLGRTLLKASIQLPDGRMLTVINTHLSAYAADESRVPQVQKVLEVWAGTPLTIVAGDMNAQPQDSAIDLFRQAGFLSAQDEAGDPSLRTYPSLNPSTRIDWIFATPDLAFRDFVIPSTTAADHLPLAVTIGLR